MAILDFLSKPLEPSEQGPEFTEWYSNIAEKSNLSPDPDDPKHYYDYRAAFKAGATLDKNNHLPSKFKHDLHPNRYIIDKDLNIYDSKKGKSATIEDLIIQSMKRKEHEAELWQ